MKKTYAVFGLGRYGIAVARELVSNGVEVIAVDSDEKIVNGMAYISDAGLCGTPDGVIGMDYESSIKRFLTAMPVRYEVAETTNLQINAVEVTLDELHATDIKRINISYVHNKEGMEAMPITA